MAWNSITNLTGPAGPAGADGASAYEVAVSGGYTGTQEEWLGSLVGAEGPQGPEGPQGIQGTPGLGITFKGQVASVGDLPTDAVQGDAYLVQPTDELYVYDEADGWINGGSIQGPQGVQGIQGPAGTDGVNGASAYEVAVGGGYTGTEAEWLGTLVGPEGPIGPEGPQGTAGAAGASAYEVAVAGGYTGTEAEWLGTLVGEQGPAGEVGADGATGPRGYGWFTGEGAPPADIPGSQPGDLYLDLLTGDVYLLS